MGGLGVPEIAIILVVIVIIFGAGRIPEIMGNMGKGIQNFKKSMREVDSDDEDKKKLEEGKNKS